MKYFYSETRGEMLEIDMNTGVATVYKEIRALGI